MRAILTKWRLRVFNGLIQREINWDNARISKYGIERFVLDAGNIASWRIEITKTEPAGYAIDNVVIKPSSASILFREEGDISFWGQLRDDIFWLGSCRDEPSKFSL